jgi:DNA-binding response OmpR family regulator
MNSSKQRGFELKSLLLIDDEPQMGALVQMSLDLDGVQVVQVRDLHQALEAAKQMKPALVLLDLALGSDDGLQILPELRNDPSFEQVPVVVFTVHPSRRREAQEAGADGFLVKPFTRKDLLKAVGSYLSTGTPTSDPYSVQDPS